MKAVHVTNEKPELPLREWLIKAGEMEANDKTAAAREYKMMTQSFPSNEKPYNRLMILFRQLKQPKDELYWINKALDVFKERLLKRNAKLTAKASGLSKAISRSTGLSGTKGTELFLPPPLDKWQKRKDLLNKKLKN